MPRGAAKAVLLAVLAAGCLAPDEHSGSSSAAPASHEGLGIPAEGANTTVDAAPAASDLGPLDNVGNATVGNATVPFLLGCQGFYLIDFGNPSVPPEDWVPEGYTIHSVGGSYVASYVFKAYRCPDLLVDNQTLLHDVSFAYLAAILAAAPGAAGALESSNLLMLEAYTDHDGFRALLEEVGLPITLAEITVAALPGAQRVDIRTAEGPVLEVSFQADASNPDNGADRSEGERLHVLNATGVHRWWDVFYLQNPAVPSTVGSGTVQGGRPAEANPTGTFTLQGNGFDHRNMRGTIHFDGR